MRSLLDSVVVNLKQHPWIILVLLICMVPLFHQLGAHSIFMWDEAIYANNAIEMLHSGDWWIIQNNGVPSQYNVKPPLVTWMQALSIWLFGVNEWALRFPSAMSGMGIVITLIYFGKRWTDSFLPGAIASIVLVSAYGFVRPHMIRTADLDAINLLFTTIYVAIGIDLLCRKGEMKRRVFIAAGFVFLAFMSKSLAGLLPLFPLMLLLLLEKRGRDIFQARSTYIAMLSGIFGIAFYYVIRDATQPGYFDLVWRSEFLRLTNDVMPWHVHGFDFYFKNFISLNYFNPHIWVLILCLALSVLIKTKSHRRLIYRMAIFVILFLLMISSIKVKLEWYDAPIYPFSALIIGTAIWALLKKPIYCLIPVSLFLIFPYRMVIKTTIKPIQGDYPLRDEGDFIKYLDETNPKLGKYQVLMGAEVPEHLDQMLFYKKKMNWYHYRNIGHHTDISTLLSGDAVVICQQKMKDEVSVQFNMQLLIKNENCALYSITSKTEID